MGSSSSKTDLPKVEKLPENNRRQSSKNAANTKSSQGVRKKSNNAETRLKNAVRSIFQNIFYNFQRLEESEKDELLTVCVRDCKRPKRWHKSQQTNPDDPKLFNPFRQYWVKNDPQNYQKTQNEQKVVKIKKYLFC